MNLVSRFAFAFIALLPVWQSAQAAQSKNPPAVRSQGNNIPAKKLDPKFNPGAPAPSELRTEGELTTTANRGQQGHFPEGASEDSRSETTSAALPNTMDGLNDKRALGIGDRLSFKVVEDEIAPRTLVVTDSSEIDVPYIGRVPVSNKTCKQFAHFVKLLLEKDYYYQATVLIGLDSAGAGTRGVSRGKVYIMGLVRSPGAMELPLEEKLTVTKAIIRAGGFAPYANKKNVKVIRGGKSGSPNKPIVVNCADILDHAQWDKDIELNPEDIVKVSEKWINLFDQ